jgi:hypothetical protein
MIVDTSHPDIWFGLAREEAHVSKTCGEVHASLDLRNKVRKALCR